MVLVVQITLLWKRSVGPAQDIGSWQVDKNLAKKWRNIQGRRNIHQEIDPNEGFQGQNYSH